MTTIAIIASLSAIVAACAGRYWWNRCTNVEKRLVDALANLDDCARERDRYRTSNAHLIREATTLCADLAMTESQLTYVRSHRQSRNAVRAGVVILAGVARPECKMSVYGELP